MGNPCRYVIDGKVVTRPSWDEDKKQLTIGQYKPLNEGALQIFYKIMQIDFYSAPDVIMTYTNGNKNKDEFRRYSRDVLKNVNLIRKEEDDDYTTYLYSYKDVMRYSFGWNDFECENNIPLGKFEGYSYEQVQNYKRKNHLCFKGETVQPSLEAVRAAWEARPNISIEDIKSILVAAYKIDM